MLRKESKRLVFVLFTPFLFPIFLFSQSPSILGQFGSTSNEVAQQMVSLDGQNLFLGASFEETLTLGQNTLTSQGKQDACVFNYNLQNDQINWVYQFSTLESNDILALAIDDDENIMVGGVFWIELVFGDTLLEPKNNPRSLFIAKLSKSGDPIWIKMLDGALINEIKGIQVDNDKNIYVNGFFSDQIDLADTSLVAVENTDGYVLKMDANGEREWIRQLRSKGTLNNGNIAISPSGKVAVTGFFDGNLFVEEDTISANSNDNDVFLVQFNNNGDYQWLRKAGGVFDDQVNAIDYGVDETIWVSGPFIGVLESENEFRLESNGGNSDLFILQYDAFGNVLQAKQFGSNLTQIPVALEVEGSTIHLIGWHQGDWSAGSVDFNGDNNRFFSFYLGLDQALESHSGLTVPSISGSVFANNLWTDDAGRTLIYGTFDEDISISNNSIQSNGLNDLFLIEIEIILSISNNSIQSNGLIRSFSDRN